MAGGLIDSIIGTEGASLVFEFDIPGHANSGYLVVMGASSKFFWSKDEALNFAESIAEHGWGDEDPSPVGISP